MNLTDLAKTLGHSEADVSRFIVALSVWTSKGCTIEQAIAKNLEVLTRITNNAGKVARVLRKDPAFISSLHRDLCAKGGAL